jgi:hypothetical protein
LPGTEAADFDMVMLGCASLLGRFGEDSLLISTTAKAYLLRHILIARGQSHRHDFNVAFLAFPETENHFLMTESSRFLANQWLSSERKKNPTLEKFADSLERAGLSLNNSAGTLRQTLLKRLQKLASFGLFENNALIYSRFSLLSLDNLYSFAADSTLRTAAQIVLDVLAAQFSVQSAGGIRYPPFRRSVEVWGDSALIDKDAACSFFGALAGVTEPFILPRQGLWNRSSGHSGTALFALLLDYRLPAPQWNMMQDFRPKFVAKIRSGHFSESSMNPLTEYYAGGPGWVLSSGGRPLTAPGANIPLFKPLPKSGPWVYDGVSRASVLLAPGFTATPTKLSQIPHERDREWDQISLSQYGALIYSAAPRKFQNEKEIGPGLWPKDYPKLSIPVKTGFFEFRFAELTHQQEKNKRLGIALFRVRDHTRHWLWTRRSWVRGGIEVIPDVENESNWEEQFLSNHRKRLRKNRNTEWRSKKIDEVLPYTTYQGVEIHLDPHFKMRGIGLRRPVRPQWDAHNAIQDFPVKTPGDESHFLDISHWDGSKKAIATLSTLGMGFFDYPQDGQCFFNFREWWRPIRVCQSSNPEEGVRQSAPSL